MCAAVPRAVTLVGRNPRTCASKAQQAVYAAGTTHAVCGMHAAKWDRATHDQREGFVRAWGWVRG